MAKVLILYYSSYGHIERMGQAECQGARSAGAEVHIKRVPELVPHKVALSANYKLEQVAPVAQIDDLVDYDAVIFGTPTRFGNMAAQMKNFIDQAGGLWTKDRLVGKIGSVFTATASQHGGQEATILSFHIVLLHLGFISSAGPIRSKVIWVSKTCRGAPPTAPRPSLVQTARACLPRSSSKRRTTKDGTLPRSRRVATVCDGPIRACVLLAASPRLRSEERSVPRQQRVGVRSPSFAY
jgi:NAD(P)H:quinone oxidoreductase type IV